MEYPGIDRSKSCMNSGALPALRAAAAPVSSSQMSPASAAPKGAGRDTAATARIACRRVIHLCPVTGIDADIAFGQIAGPEHSCAFAAAANQHADFTLGRVQLLFEFGLGKGRG